MKLDTSPPRGMRDILPDEAALRDWATSTILGVYRRHGFSRIETPAVESLGLLTRSEGGENEKLIFKILKRGEKLHEVRDVDDLADLGLRFDLTVPLARYYAHNHARLPAPLKAIQIGPVWRADRPQQGRYRQFTQCDIDILGVSSEVAEIELILATAEALHGLGLGDLTVRINDRRVLAAMAAHCGFEESRFDDVFVTLDKLDKIGRDGVIAELEAAGHGQPAIRALFDVVGVATAGGPAETLGALGRALGGRADDSVWAGLSRILDVVGTQVEGRLGLEFDATLVRGMGYYTGPIFEMRYRDSPLSVAGGGRYDRMIGKLLGRDVPATGFSIGFERVVGLLLQRAQAEGAGEDRVALVVDGASPHLGLALSLAREFREKGSAVLVELRARKLGKQLQDLESRGYRRIALVADDGALDWRGPGARASAAERA